MPWMPFLDGKPSSASCWQLPGIGFPWHCKPLPKPARQRNFIAQTF
jgi:hypothetical protein